MAASVIRSPPSSRSTCATAATSRIFEAKARRPGILDLWVRNATTGRMSLIRSVVDADRDSGLPNRTLPTGTVPDIHQGAAGAPDLLRVAGGAQLAHPPLAKAELGVVRSKDRAWGSPWSRSKLTSSVPRTSFPRTTRLQVADLGLHRARNRPLRRHGEPAPEPPPPLPRKRCPTCGGIRSASTPRSGIDASWRSKTVVIPSGRRKRNGSRSVLSTRSDPTTSGGAAESRRSATFSSSTSQLPTVASPSRRTR